MKTTKNYLLLILLFTFSFVQQSNAQESEATRIQSLDFLKVEAGNIADYLAMEKAWKKIHQYNKDQGKISGWELTQVISPSGSQTEYNFVTRISLKEGKQYSDFMEEFPMPKDLSSILSPDEIKLVNKTGKLRTYVKNEIFYVMESVFDEGNEVSTIQVFNYFDHPEGKNRSDHVKNELDVWMPVHKLRVENDNMEGWVLARKSLPFGANQEYHEITVDVYKDMAQYLSGPNFESFFKKAHPGKDLDKLMQQTGDSGIIVKGEVRKLVDYLED